MARDKEEVQRKSQSEVAEWVKLSEEHLLVLQRLQKVCHYCSERMTPAALNRDCPVNSLASLPPKCRHHQFQASASRLRRKPLTQADGTSSESPASAAGKRPTGTCRRSLTN